MTEPSAGTPPVALSIAVDTEWGAKRAKVPLDADVGHFVATVVSGCGGDPGDDTPRYSLEVPLSASDEQGRHYHEVSHHERLVDALRGVQHRPQIVPNPNYDNE